MWTRPIARFPFWSWAAETWPISLSIQPAFVARSPITRASVYAIFAFMLCIAFGRRGLAHPRRQHFQVNQVVELDRGVRHECSLPQAENKTSALSNLIAQFWPILLLAVRQRVG